MQRRDQLPAEGAGVVVALIDRQPGDSRLIQWNCRQLISQERRLAKTSGCSNERELCLASPIQPPPEPRS
jgi:hypothetical protein